ncbi:ankyrin repeat-containing protein [European chub iridovirus]|nr:ankyrin repeat-containing protein [European chub iridovirus]
MESMFSAIERYDVTTFHQMFNDGVIALHDLVLHLCLIVHLRTLKMPHIWETILQPFGIDFILNDRDVQQACIHELITLYNKYLVHDLQTAVAMGFTNVARDVESYVCKNTSDRLMHKAATCNDEELMRFLIRDLGMDASITNDLGKTMFECTRDWTPEKMYTFYVNDLKQAKSFVFERACCMSDAKYVHHILNKINSDDVTDQALYHAARNNHCDIVCKYIDVLDNAIAFYDEKEGRNVLFYMLRHYHVAYQQYISKWTDVLVDTQLKWYPMHVAAYYCTKSELRLTRNRDVECKQDAYGRDVFMLAVHGLVDYRTGSMKKDWTKLKYIIYSLPSYNVIKPCLLSSILNGELQHSACGLDVMLAALLRYAHVVAPLDPTADHKKLYIRNGLLFAYKLFPEMSMETITYRKLMKKQAYELMKIKAQMYSEIMDILDRRSYSNQDRSIFFDPKSTIYSLLNLRNIPSLKRMCTNLSVTYF